mmetsp:Transcript_50835/g.128226  ORF Transcript_50835/g.128226 Transcript_50835/m.128226 type:complete len:243 (-) Transcript_50835:341-1069(-)
MRTIFSDSGGGRRVGLILLRSRRRFHGRRSGKELLVLLRRLRDEAGCKLRCFGALRSIMPLHVEHQGSHIGGAGGEVGASATQLHPGSGALPSDAFHVLTTGAQDPLDHPELGGVLEAHWKLMVHQRPGRWLLRPSLRRRRRGRLSLLLLRRPRSGWRAIRLPRVGPRRPLAAPRGHGDPLAVALLRAPSLADGRRRVVAALGPRGCCLLRSLCFRKAPWHRWIVRRHWPTGCSQQGRILLC